MKRMYVDELVPGMKLAKSVETLGGKMLLEVGTELTQQYIAGLIDMDVIEVYVQEENPEFREKRIVEINARLRETDPAPPAPGAGMPGDGEAHRRVSPKRVADEMQGLRRLSGEVFRFDYRDFRRQSNPIKEFVNKFVDLVDEAAEKNRLGAPVDAAHYLPAHSMNVLALSLLVSRELKLDREERVNLGLGAFLHDIGMYEVPRELWDHDGRLDARQRNGIQKHPLIGRDIIGEHFIDYSTTVKQIVYMHHERQDGSGYQRMSGSSIPPLARLVALADVYEALTAPRRHRKAGDRIYALQQIMLGAGTRFDPGMVRVLCRALSLTPVGSRVTLDDGGVWQVIDAHPDYPFRPRIAALDGGEVVDLRDQPFRVVMDQIRYQDLSICGESSAIMLLSGSKFARDSLKKLKASSLPAGINAALKALGKDDYGHIELVRADEKQGRLFFLGRRLFESMDAEEILPTDYFAAGFIQEAVKRLSGRDALCFEYQCAAQGAPHCRFYAAIKE